MHNVSVSSIGTGVLMTGGRAQIRVDRKPAKKGYMRLHTNLGDLNLELHCNIVPRACENFLILAESGYYSNSVFHRSIKNFMIQVGFVNAATLCPQDQTADVLAAT